MILTFSDSEEEILNKIKSVLVCENTVEFMDNVNIQKLRFPSLEIDQLQRCVIREDKTVGLTRHEYDLLLYLALSPNRVFTKEQIYQHIYEEAFQTEIPYFSDIHVIPFSAMTREGVDEVRDVITELAEADETDAE